MKINGNLKSPNLYSQINYAARSPETSASFASDKLSQGSNSTITKIKNHPTFPATNSQKKKKNKKETNPSCEDEHSFKAWSTTNKLRLIKQGKI